MRTQKGKQAPLMPCATEKSTVSTARRTADRKMRVAQREEKPAKKGQKLAMPSAGRKPNASRVRARKTTVVQPIASASQNPVAELTRREISIVPFQTAKMIRAVNELTILPCPDGNEETGLVPSAAVAVARPLNLLPEDTQPPTVVAAEPCIDEAGAVELPAAHTEMVLPEPLRERGLLLRALTQGWKWIEQRFKSHQTRKRLRVCESVSLGEKRFIAVVQVDGEQFLVGGSSDSIATLARLSPAQEFSDLLRGHCTQELGQA